MAISSRKFAADVGDGESTTITVTHDLGTKDVAVEVYTNADPWDTVLVEPTRPSDDEVGLVFTEPPATVAFRVVVLA